MHFNDGSIPGDYKEYIHKKILLIVFVFVALLMSVIISISQGAVRISILDVFQILMPGAGSASGELIIWNIRLPQTLAAIVAGAGLAGSGAVMQSVLKNPLASPFTLGISHAAAFGAALSVMILGNGMMTNLSSQAVTITNPFVTVACAFFFAMLTAAIIVFIAKNHGASAQVMVLTGVALGSLFTAGTMMLQFFADDVQLAAMVFWTFGDLARIDWQDLSVLSAATFFILVFFMANTRSYNAMGLGDETAKGLGINVENVRLYGMVAASLATALIISFAGIISFVGLVAPHIVRRLIGDDHRFLVPAALLSGALILLASDIAARLVLQPHVLPVSIFTAFLGAPVFIYLIIKGDRP